MSSGKPGDNGFGPNSSFNWVLSRAHLEERLQLRFPTTVGRLTFQVGSRATSDYN